MVDDALAGDLAIAVVRLARHLRLRRETTTLTLSQFSAMSTLHRDGPMTAGTLATRERVRPPSMTRVVAALVEAGMVTRSPHATDRRLSILTLTPAGAESVTTSAQAREQWLHDQLEHLPPEQRATLDAGAHIIERILAASDYRDSPTESRRRGQFRTTTNT